jgi:hypothetical protein
LIFWVVLALLVAACTTAEVPIPVPTLTLIPPTVTSTSTPVTPTTTPVGLPGPADLVTPTANSGLLLIPDQARPLLQRALTDLADRLTIPEEDIQVMRLETAVWTSIDLGCGAEDLPGFANLEIDGFRFVLQVGDVQYEYHADTRSSVQLCEDGEHIAGRTGNLLLDTDPVAAEMVALAQRRLADDLELPSRRIQVVDAAPYTWSDSSLGCPQPGIDYPSISIDGYRIVLQVADQQYIFHTDSTQLIACDAENEQLPG